MGKTMNYDYFTYGDVLLFSIYSAVKVDLKKGIFLLLIIIDILKENSNVLQPFVGSCPPPSSPKVTKHSWPFKEKCKFCFVALLSLKLQTRVKIKEREREN